MTDADKAYMEKEPTELHDTDPAKEVFGTFKALIVVLAVCIAVTLISFFTWGK
jgi:hypothetical protein